MGGPRALRIEVGHGHAAPFLIDMFVYCMITPYCTKFDRLTNRKFIEIVDTRGQILMAKCTKIDFGWDCAPDPAGGAYYAPSDPLVGCGGGYPLPIPYRLSPSAPMAPRPSRLRRSAASQRLKPTLLLPSGAATVYLAVLVDIWTQVRSGGQHKHSTVVHSALA